MTARDRGPSRRRARRAVWQVCRPLARVSRSWALWAWMAWAAVPCAAARAAEPAPPDVPDVSSQLVVGISADYAPFSLPATPEGRFEGFEIDLARAYAAERGLRLHFVRFAWPELSADLRAGRFDVAMSGVTMRPERSVWGRFALPVVRSGAILLAPAADAPTLAGLDRAGCRIAVNRGGHLERVARAHFVQADVVALAPNDAVHEALVAGAVDALITDTLEAVHWERAARAAGAPPWIRLGPISRDLKAAWFAPGRTGRARDFDAWLIAREADGALGALRARWGVPAERVATPLGGSIAGVAERLSLMPFVAAWKQAHGVAVRDPAREARVVRAGLRDVRREAEAAGIAPPAAPRVERFVRAQIEAAVFVQERALAGGGLPEPLFDLGEALRPALLRIGSRQAFLGVRLEEVDPERLEERLAGALAVWRLPDALLRELAEGLAGLGQERVQARASRPATIGSARQLP